MFYTSLDGHERRNKLLTLHFSSHFVLHFWTLSSKPPGLNFLCSVWWIIRHTIPIIVNGSCVSNYHIRYLDAAPWSYLLSSCSTSTQNNTLGYCCFWRWLAVQVCEIESLPEAVINFIPKPALSLFLWPAKTAFSLLLQSHEHFILWEVQREQNLELIHWPPSVIILGSSARG